VTSMPKPLAEHPGPGMHLHVSLFEGEPNAFHDPAPGAALSPTGRSFIAGLLAHARELTAVTDQWVTPTGGWPAARGASIGELDAARPELRCRFLAAPGRQRELAEAVGQTLADAIAWATEGVCGYAGDRVMAHMRTQEPDARAFAVSFVSVMAGLMLAAQTFKDALAEGPLAGAVSRAVMQFMDPLAVTNRPRRYLRNTSCAMCSPSTPAGVISANWYRAA